MLAVTALGTGKGQMLCPGSGGYGIANPTSLINDELLGTTRALGQSLLRAALPQELFPTPDAASMYACHLEACVAALTIVLGHNKHSVYMSAIGRTQHNLEENGRLIVNTYPLNQICFLSHRKLTGKTHAAREAAVESRISKLFADIDARCEGAKAAVAAQRTTVLTCSKCGATTGLEQQPVQDRSGDEGMSVYVLCTCGHNWRL